MTYMPHVDEATAHTTDRTGAAVLKFRAPKWTALELSPNPLAPRLGFSSR